MYKLGNRVKFNRELSFYKNSKYEEEQSRTLKIKHQEDKIGIVCGVRTYPSKAILRNGWDSPDQLEVTQYQKVYLIATDLRGFHRVPEEWLELVPTDEDIAKLNELERCRELLKKFVLL